MKSTRSSKKSTKPKTHRRPRTIQLTDEQLATLHDDIKFENLKLREEARNRDIEVAKLLGELKQAKKMAKCAETLLEKSRAILELDDEYDD